MVAWQTKPCGSLDWLGTGRHCSVGNYNQTRVMSPGEGNQRGQNPNPHRKREGRAERLYAVGINPSVVRHNGKDQQQQLTSGLRLAKAVEAIRNGVIRMIQKWSGKMAPNEKPPQELGHK